MGGLALGLDAGLLLRSLLGRNARLLFQPGLLGLLPRLLLGRRFGRRLCLGRQPRLFRSDTRRLLLCGFLGGLLLGRTLCLLLGRARSFKSAQARDLGGGSLRRGSSGGGLGVGSSGGGLGVDNVDIRQLVHPLGELGDHGFLVLPKFWVLHIDEARHTVLLLGVLERIPHVLKRVVARVVR